MTAGDNAADQPTSVVRPAGFPQFIKFCVVGLSNTAIHFGVFNAVLLATDLRTHPYGVNIAAGIAFIFAATNGFVWNRQWTFRGRGHIPHEYARAICVYTVGLVLNQGITRGAVLWLAGAGGVALPSVLAANLTQIAATGVVVFWNFFMFRFWVFQRVARPDD